MGNNTKLFGRQKADTTEKKRFTCIIMLSIEDNSHAPVEHKVGVLIHEMAEYINILSIKYSIAIWSVK